MTALDLLRPTRPRFAVALLLAAFVAPAPGQEPDPAARHAFLENTQVLRRIFKEQNYQPLDLFDQLDVEPQKSVLVLLGGIQVLEEVRPRWLQMYLLRGGAVLVASHNRTEGRTGNELAEVTGVRITGSTLVLDPSVAVSEHLGYQNRRHCPFLRPTAAGQLLFRDPRDPQLSLQVAANAPSCFAVRAFHQLPNLIDLPHQCVPQDVVSDEDYTHRFAVGGSVGVQGGRVLVLADHRLFLNRMMLPTDTGNVEFAENCLAFLNNPNSEKRNRLLFVDRGTINAEFDVKVDVPPKLPDDILGRALNALNELPPKFEAELVRLEEENAFNRWIWRWMASERISPAELRKRIVLVCTFLFFIWGVFRVTAGRYRLAATTPGLTQSVSAHRPIGSLAARRRHAILESDNLYEPARALARKIFTEVGVAVPRPGQRLPRIVTSVGWWRGWKLRRRVRRLWRLAFEAVPRAVPKKAWPILQRELDELKAALANGSVRIVPVG